MRIFGGLVLLLSVLASPRTALAQCGWQPGLEAAGTNGSVHVIHPWDPDGPDGPEEECVIIGGDFSFAGSLETADIAVWRPSDRTWISLGDGLGFLNSWHSVSSVATLPDGRVVAGGGFRVTDGAPANYIAQWDGIEWSPIGSPLNDSVSALAVTSDGRLIAGGSFRLPSEDGLTSIAVLEDDTWVPLRADEWDGTFGQVTDIAVLPDDRIVAVGSYYNENQEVGAPLAIWNGTAWSYMGMTGGTIHAMAVSSEGYVAIAGIALGPEYIAIWQGGTWEYVKKPYGAVETREMVFLSTGELVVDFQMTTWGLPGVASGPQSWNGAKWTRLGIGRPGSNYAEALSRMSDDRVVVARAIPEIWDGVRWLPFGRGIGGVVRDVMAKLGGGVYVGGSFDWVGDQSAMGIAQLAEGGWQPLGDAFTPGGAVSSMLLNPDGALLAAGGFDHESASGTVTVGTWIDSGWEFMPPPPRPSFSIGIFRWPDASLGFISDVPYKQVSGSWVKAPTGFTSLVYSSLVLRDGDIVFTGAFTAPGNRIAKWAGGTWHTLGSGLGGYGYCLLECSNGDIIAGGRFRDAGGKTVSYIARWDGVAWHDLAGGMSEYATVSALVELPNGDIVAGGTFTSAGGTPANNIARWDGTQWHPLGGGTNGHVTAFDVLDDGSLAVGGYFSHVDGKPSAHYARYVFEGSAPEITDEPADAIACASTLAEVNVSATPSAGLTYQWEIRDESTPAGWAALEDGPLSIGGEPIAEITGSRTDLLILIPVVDAFAVQVRCVLANGCGNATTQLATITACRADYSCDGLLDISDLTAYLDAFVACEGLAAGCSSDGIDPNLNVDGVVDIMDLLMYLDSFGSGC